MRPSGSHGGECVAGSVSSAVGSLGLGHTAGRAADGDSPGSDPTLGLLWRLSWGARHDNMIGPAGGLVRQR